MNEMIFKTFLMEGTRDETLMLIHTATFAEVNKLCRLSLFATERS